MFEDTTQKMLKFIEESPSCYHVVENLRKELKAQKFTELQEKEIWRLKKGGKWEAEEKPPAC